MQCFWKCIGVSKGLVALCYSAIRKNSNYNFPQLSKTGVYAQDQTIRLLEETTMESPDNFQKGMKAVDLCSSSSLAI
jgi:hypothetical protein